MWLLDPARPAEPTDYHLVAGIPTPNGPAHLGHVGGPFLRMDILARFQRLCGNRTFLISGTDAHESHVPLTAERAGTGPAEIAGRYHREISRDLASIDVLHDAFIDPLDPRWASRYARWHHHLLGRLRELGRVVEVTERVPFSRASGRPLLGGFLAGRCPECGSAVVGTSCEECGMWFSPETIVDPRPNLAHDGDIEWRAVSNLFLRLDDRGLHELLADRDLEPGHRQVLAGYLAREGPYWRLTQQGGWGVAAPSEVTAPGIFATYGLGILAYAALCGEEYGVLSGRGVNALAAGSGVVAVSAQGFDSIVPDIFAVLVLGMFGPELRPFDQLTMNRFILLEGSKFSTSRRHAIWTRKFTAGVDSDLVRHYLARISPDETETDFRVEDFVALANRHVVHDLQRVADTSWDRLEHAPASATTTPAGRLVSRLAALLEQQRSAVDPGRLRVAEVVSALDAWPDTAPGPAQDAGRDAGAYWWLKGAAVLAWSLMPRWAMSTWRRLGHAGEPALADFWQTPSLRLDEPARHFQPQDVGQVRRLAGGETAHA
jgi:methionyl-tRNA synthetase